MLEEKASFSGNPVACLEIKVTTEPQLLMLYYFSAWIHQDGGKSVQRTVDSCKVLPQLHSRHVPTADLDSLRRSNRYYIEKPFQSFFGGGSLIGGSFVGGSLIGGLGSSSFDGGLGGSSSVILTANTALFTLRPVDN
jgi:hypothetical protein